MHSWTTRDLSKHLLDVINAVILPVLLSLLCLLALLRASLLASCHHQVLVELILAIHPVLQLTNRRFARRVLYVLKAYLNRIPADTLAYHHGRMILYPLELHRPRRIGR